MVRGVLRACFVAAVLWRAAAACGEGNPPEPQWQALPVEGGIDTLARAAGIEPGLPAWRVLYEACRGRHGLWGEDAGSVQADEQAGTARPGSVPLPLAPSFWRSLIRQGKGIPDGRLALAIVSDRRAALSYRGLAALDEETLAALAREPDTLLRIARRHGDVLAAFAARFAVRGGVVAVPGGAEAEAVWQQLVGESAARPARFLLKLVERDLGRMAFFYDSIARLDRQRQRFALGLAAEAGSEASAPARALYATFAREGTWWRAGRGAFARPDADAARLLREVRLGEDGRLAPPASRAFWDAVFEGRSPSGADAPEASATVDAAWLASRIGAGDPTVRRLRLEQLAFAQRAFGAAADAAPREAAEALSGLRDVRALLLVLERMGVRDPGLLASATRAARSWMRSGSSDDAAQAVAAAQGVLGLVDRARFHGAIDAVAAERLVRALLTVALSPAAPWEGGLLGFVEGTLVAELGRAVGGAGDAERVALRAMAGAAEARPAGTVFDWEGHYYRAQPERAELLRLQAVRKRQAAPTLTDTLSACRARGGATADRPACYRELGTTLVSLVYAAHLGPEDGPALRGEDPSRRHAFGSDPWALPVEVTGPGVAWHVQGSLLGLETALARLGLHRLDQDAMPERPPVIDASQRRSLAVSAGLASPLELHDADRDALARAVAAGRKRARDLAAGSADLDAAVRDAGLDPWRARALEWLLVHEKTALADFFSLGELAYLGAPEGGPWDEWGAHDPVVAGLHLRLPRPRPLDEGAGRRPEPTLAESFVGLGVRIAVHLADRGLPACLAPALAWTLLPELFNEARPVAPDDRLALEAWARDQPAERLDDAVASLVGRGPLQPASGPGRTR